MQEMSQTQIELTIEKDTGLTPSAIEAQFQEQYSDELASINVIQN